MCKMVQTQSPDHIQNCKEDQIFPYEEAQIAVKSGSEDNNGDNARISEKSNLQEVAQRGRDSVTC